MLPVPAPSQASIKQMHGRLSCKSQRKERLELLPLIQQLLALTLRLLPSREQVACLDGVCAGFHHLGIDLAYLRLQVSNLQDMHV